MKFNTRINIFSIFVILTIIFKVNSDIPVHCLKSQIVGTWTFHATIPETKNINELYTHTCGHKNPSNESTSLNFNMNKNLFQRKYFVDLQESNKAIISTSTETDSNKNGIWTMVYDEGFDIKLQENETKEKSNFFVFNKYSLNNKSNPSVHSKWASHCFSTLIGWYHIGNKWGCFYATKNKVDSEQITNGEAENKLNVLENQITAKDDKSNNFRQQFSTVNIFFEKQEKSLVEPDILDNKITEAVFLETKSREKLTLHSKFKDHAKFVEKINAMNVMWKAHNYNQFSDMTIEELNSFAGRSRRNKKLNLKKKNIFISNKHQELLDNQNKFLETSNKLKKNYKDEENSIALPDEFLDYKNFTSTPRSQVNIK